MKYIIFFLAFLMFILSNQSQAEWPQDLSKNLPICTDANEQTTPFIVSDNSGGCIILWADKRNGDYDLYAQRVSADGQLLWQEDGIPVYKGRGDQLSHLMISNGQGGAYVTWLSNNRIYAQQLSPDGTLRWNQPLLLCSSTYNQSACDICSDLNGGFIAVWVASTSRDDIIAQRVNANGDLLWSESGKIVADNWVYACREPKVTATVAGGAIVLFEMGWVDYDYYLMILDQSGNRKLSNEGIKIGPHDGRHDLVSDGLNGAIITWEYQNEIYANRIDNTGSKLWGENGITVCEAGTDKDMPFISSDGQNGAYILWHDYTKYYYSYCDIYAQHIDQAGTKLWSPDGIQVSNLNDLHEWGGSLQTDAKGHLIIAWETDNNKNSHWWSNDHKSSENVWVQQINTAGNLNWANGFKMSTEPTQKFLITSLADGNDGIIAAWVDKRNGNLDIYAQRVGIQTAESRIAGKVTNVSLSTPISGAKLILSGPKTDVTWSDADGNYKFVVDPGTGYSIEASAPDFETARQDNITVTIGQTTPVNFALQPQVKPPRNLQAQITDGKVLLSWQAPEESSSQEELALDDGTFEWVYGWENIQGVVANGPFIPSQYPASITTARILFDSKQAGDKFKIYVYLDPAGTATRPAANLLKGTVGPATIAGTGTWQDVDLSALNLTLTAGRIFIGVQQLGSRPMWIGLDENGPGSKAFIDSNLDGVFTPLSHLNPPQKGVFAIRTIVSLTQSASNQPIVLVPIDAEEPSNEPFSNPVENNTDVFGALNVHRASLSAVNSQANAVSSHLNRANSSLISYNIYRAQSSPVPITNKYCLGNVASGSTQYTDATVVSGQTYYYAVTATYDIGESVPSNEVKVTMPGGGFRTTVRIEPAIKDIQKNQTGTTNVVVDSVKDLGSFEFTIQYDPTIVQIPSTTDVTLGSFLGSTGRTVSPVGPDIDNVNGKLTFGAFSFGSQTPPSTNHGGVLATIRWSAQNNGETPVDLTEVKLTQPNGSAISPLNVVDGKIRVTSSGCFWADIDCDGDVDVVDIQLVAGRWNTRVGDPNYDPKCDVDNEGQGDGDIDIVDIQLVAGWWNKTLPQAGGGLISKQKTSHLTNLTVNLKQVHFEKAGNRIIDVAVENITDLGAFEFDFIYDDQSIQIESVETGDFKQAKVKTWHNLGPAFDPTDGKFTFGAFSFGSESGPTGSLVLARVKLKLKTNGTQNIRLEQIKITDSQGKVFPVNTSSTLALSSELTGLVPLNYSLSQNFPNPFNPTTSITFGIPETHQKNQQVRTLLQVFNLEGQLIKTLVNGELPVGYHCIGWDGVDENNQRVSSGIYFYTLRIGEYTKTRKMVLTK